MKHLNFVSFLLMLCILSTSVVAQNSSIYGPQVLKMKGGPHDYIPNQVIVKFKDDSGIKIKTTSSRAIKTTSVSRIDRMLTSLGIKEASQLMPLIGALKLNKNNIKLKSFLGRVVEEPDMSRLYLLEMDSTSNQSIETVIKQLQTLDEVEYAEPNYRVYAMSTGESATYTAEPLYSQQWGLGAINMPALWDMPKINDKRPVIAIIDTGVDVSHPDLADNIWTNTKEVEGTELEDDDANGFVDDVHGWDFVDKTPIMTDPNGHGTHCTGIAAAVGNNGIGITGANPDALIMPIRVMEPDGVGSMSVIIKGIDYATANGADVLSMSFGSKNSSVALYEALKKAYQNAVLVGAAGNYALSIYRIDGRIFPGAYDIVLGVQASNKQGGRCSFSNYDPDGPYYVNTDWFSEYWNYEILATGDDIMSTFPGGKYKMLSGTSMATPLVAGAVSRLLQTKPAELYRDTRFGDIIAAKNAETGVFDAFQAYSYNEDNRQVMLSLLKVEVCDSVSGDGDGNLDAGEIVELYPTLRSEWGHALNVKVSIEADSRYESASSIEVLDNNVDFGYSLNSRGIGKATTPVRIKINPDLKDSHNLKLIIRATCDNIAEELTHEVDFNVENGVELGGMITENTTLYPDVHYIVTRNLIVPDDVTLTIKPGTILKFKGGSSITLSKNAHFECNGKPDSLITFTMAEGYSSRFNGINHSVNDWDSYTRKTIRYALFNNLFCLQIVSNIDLENCIINNNQIAYSFSNNLERCNFYSNLFNEVLLNNSSRGKTVTMCNIIYNQQSMNAMGVITINSQSDFTTVH